MIKGLAGNHTVILSSHILPEVEQTCARVVIINKGKIIAIDSPEKLSMSLRGANLYTIRVRRPSPELENNLKTLQGVVDFKIEEDGSYVMETGKDVDIREEIAELVVGRKAGLLELRPVAFTLEDVFVQLTTAEQSTSAPTEKTT
jgi:ABC-2 type transport system ATP-binding protein